jgi:hypothetical protein
MNHYFIRKEPHDLYYNVQYGSELVECFRIKGTSKQGLQVLIDHMNENLDIKLATIGKMLLEGPPHDCGAHHE